jgi:hypothetical protein
MSQTESVSLVSCIIFHIQCHFESLPRIWRVYVWFSLPVYEGLSKSFRTGSITKYTLTTINTRWEATQSVTAVKLTRMTHSIAIQLHLMAESFTICSSRSRWPVRKLLDIPSYGACTCGFLCLFIVIFCHRISFVYLCYFVRSVCTRGRCLQSNIWRILIKLGALYYVVLASRLLFFSEFLPSRLRSKNSKIDFFFNWLLQSLSDLGLP